MSITTCANLYPRAHKQSPPPVSWPQGTMDETSFREVEEHARHQLALRHARSAASVAVPVGTPQLPPYAALSRILATGRQGATRICGLLRGSLATDETRWMVQQGQRGGRWSIPVMVLGNPFVEVQCPS